jgi:hypothetical protein
MSNVLNTFAVIPGVTGKDISCPCCGTLKVDQRILNFVESLMMKYDAGSEIIVNGYMCQRAVRAWLREQRPGYRRLSKTAVRLQEGKAAILSLPVSDELRTLANLAQIEVTGLESPTHRRDSIIYLEH